MAGCLLLKYVAFMATYFLQSASFMYKEMGNVGIRRCAVRWKAVWLVAWCVGGGFVSGLPPGPPLVLSIAGQTDSRSGGCPLAPRPHCPKAEGGARGSDEHDHDGLATVEEGRRQRLSSSVVERSRDAARMRPGVEGWR